MKNRNSIKTSTVFRLVESKDKEGKEWDVVIIQPGLSKNKKFYSKEVLKKALPLFENLKAFAYEFKGRVFNHLPEFARDAMPQGFVKNLAGWYDNIRYGNFKDEHGEVKEGVLGTFHATAQWLKDFLKETWEHGKAKMLGISIDGGGKVEREFSNGREIDRVLEINDLTSADPVTHEAAGGGFLRLVASENMYEGGSEMEFIKKLIEMLKEKHADLVEGIDSENVTDEQFVVLMETAVADDKVEEILKEGFVADAIEKLLKMVKDEKALAVLKDLSARLKKYGYPSPMQASEEEAKAKAEAEEKAKVEAEAKAEGENKKDGEESKEMKEMKEAIAKMEHENALAKSQAILSEVLAESKLLEPVKEKIRKQFTDRIFKKEELQEAIKVEKDMLAKLSESGDVKGLGDGRVEIRLDESDKLQAALDKMIDPEASVDESMKGVPGFRGLKEAYGAFYPDDKEVTGQAVDPARRFSRLTENITTADFTYALSVSVTKRAAKEFVLVPFIYAPIVEERPLINFKQQEIIKWGGLSTLPTVLERGNYADLYEPSDSRATYTPTKKGGLVYVTRETIKNDDMRYIQKLPRKINTAAKKTLERDITNLLVTNPTYIPTGVAAFTAAQGNYSVVALSYDNLTDRKNAMKKQRENGAAQSKGTSTEATANTLSDTDNVAIVDDAFNGYYIRIVYGTGAGQTRLISATATSGSTITVSAVWTTNPDDTSKYEISTATNDDEKVGLKAKYILYGDALESMVDSLLNSDKNPENANNQNNVHRNSLTPIYVPNIEGSTYQYYWFLAADKAQTEIIEIGYVDNQRTPMLLVQDQPNLGNVFTADEIRYKVRWEYGYATVENKGLDGNFGTTI